MDKMDKSLARIDGATLRAILAGGQPAAFLHDGGGLYLNVAPTGAAWVLRYTFGGRRQKIGLGILRDVSATTARQIAARHRQTLADGNDPKAKRAEAVIQMQRSRKTTFKAVADKYLVDEIDGGNLHPITKQGWRQSLRDHVYPKIGHLALEEINRTVILNVLRPIWPRIHVTAKSIRQRIEMIFDEAIHQGLTDQPNPARWLDLRRGLAHHLPDEGPKPHPAMPWQEVPAFYRQVRAQDGYTPRALMLAILSGSRTQEALGARFDEFQPGEDGQLVGGIWTVPKERMKGKPGKRKPHLVPITSEIAAIVEEMQIVRRGACLFPHRFKSGQPLTRSSVVLLLTKLKVRGRATTHGFRSTFKDWVSDNGFDDRAGERSLAHAVPGVAGHYDRTTMLAMRQDLMQHWTDFVTGKTGMEKPTARPTLKVVGGSAA